MTLTNIVLIAIGVIAILGAAGAFAIAYRRSQKVEAPDPTSGVSAETRAADRSMAGVRVAPIAVAEPEPEVVQKPTQPTVQQQAAKPAAPVLPSVAPAAPSAADVARVSAAKITWRGLLQAHLQRFQKYPRSAQRRNIEGTVWLRFRMGRDGKVLGYSIERTSEHDVLDEAALAMLERAQPLPPLPDDVPGQSIELIIPANFNIDDR